MSPILSARAPERALRALLLGISHRTLRLWAPARALLEAARSTAGIKVSTWIAGVARFELAVTNLKEVQSQGAAVDGTGWLHMLAPADAKLAGAQGDCGEERYRFVVVVGQPDCVVEE
jgi:hypothetical protein